MGHIQPGCEAAGSVRADAAVADPAETGRAISVGADAPQRRDRRRWRPDPLADQRLWVLWNGLMAAYPLWRSVVTAMTPWSGFRKENSYFWFDVIRGLRSMPSSQRVVERLRTVSNGELDGVIALAEVNSKRQEHFFRTLVLSYVTVPFTVGAIWAQLTPGQLIRLLGDERYQSAWIGAVAGLATALLVRFIADWRARSFLTLLQMARIERGVATDPSPETRSVR